MDNAVLDASAMLAMLQQEPGGRAVFDLLNSEDVQVAISAINFCEVATKLRRDGGSAASVEVLMKSLREWCVAFDDEQALLAADLVVVTAAYGLSLADRSCLALAIMRDAEAWTTDEVWQKIDIGAKVKLLRAPRKDGPTGSSRGRR